MNEQGKMVRTRINVSISRGKKYAVYSDDLLKYVKRELALGTAKDTRDFLTCAMDQETYDRTILPRL